ncbi:hypothetical protein [Prauserella muralis]|uniref:Uncharacterized protein n=1 Tax=Prauserella muralis TaxID=588067 RepID=A0A2V4B1K7_9PSEU|nr:hypothetical protein [Prauserella muralis]PXY27025.1 hypothetical protein BAY60_11050 [Prauserella muralis]TWE23353.1 hypothetical protein FHX69_4616 [Prauserella muralis]
MGGQPAPRDRAERIEEALSVPVLVAALVSVPAVFLTTTDGTTAVIGRTLNWLSLAVLLGESLILLWLSGSVVTWLRRYRWQVLVAGAAVPAVVFVVGPVQILRLLLAVGALRVLRAGRILRAARVIRRRAGLAGRRGRWLLAGAGLLAAGFVVVVLANPESRSRKLLAGLVNGVGPVPTALLGLAALLLVAAAIAVVRRYRSRAKAMSVMPGTGVQSRSGTRAKPRRS